MMPTPICSAACAATPGAPAGASNAGALTVTCSAARAGTAAHPGAGLEAGGGPSWPRWRAAWAALWHAALQLAAPVRAEELDLLALARLDDRTLRDIGVPDGDRSWIAERRATADLLRRLETSRGAFSGSLGGRGPWDSGRL